MKQYLLNINNYNKKTAITPRINLLKTYTNFSYKFKNDKKHNLLLIAKNNIDIKRNKNNSIKYNLLKTQKMPFIKIRENNKNIHNIINNNNSLSYKIIQLNNNKNPSLYNSNYNDCSDNNKKIYSSLDNYIEDKNMKLLKTNPLIIITEKSESQKKQIKIKSFNFSYFNNNKMKDFSSSRNYERLDNSYKKFVNFLKIKKNKLDEKKRIEYKKYYNDMFIRSLNVKKLTNIELSAIKDGYSLLNKMKLKKKLNKINLNKL